MRKLGKILFVDDCPERLEALQSLNREMAGVVPALTVCDALNKLRDDGPWDVVFLDRDMGEERVMDPYPYEPSGEDVAYAIANGSLGWKPKLVVVHSLNFDRARLMLETLKKGNIRHARIPFTDLIQYPLNNLWGELGW